MKIEDFLQQARTRGFKTVNRTIVGVADGYPVSVNVVKSYGSFIASVSVRAALKDPKRARKAIKNDLPKNVGVGANKAIILLTLRGNGDAFFDEVERAARSATARLREYGAPPPSKCAVCKGEGADSFGWHKMSYTSVHRACVEKITNREAEDIKARNERGSYFGGFIGALLGSFVGMIPTFFSIYFTDYIVGYLCALIPLASAAGYKLFKGKPQKPSRVIVICCSILQVFILEASLWYAYVSQYFNITPRVWDTILYYFHTFDSDMAVNLLQKFAFVVIGIFFSFAFINKTAGTGVNAPGEILDSLVAKV